MWVLGLGLLAAAIPPVLNESQRTVYVLAMLAAMVTTGLTLLMGFAGQVSLGQGAFYAIGAYVATLLAKHGLPSPLGLLLAPLATAAVAALIGIPLLRLRGHYLAFATLAFQLIVISVIAQWKGLTGGDVGLGGIPALGLGGIQLSSSLHYCYLSLAVLGLVVVLSRNLVRSRPGRGMRALATSEVAAAASGVAVAAYKIRIFALSAGFAGLAGGIYGFFLQYLSPGSFPLFQSVQFLVMAAVGGLGEIWGAVVGAVAITLLGQVLQQIGSSPGLPRTAPAILNYSLYGLLLILVMVLLPDGVLPSFRRLWRRLRR